MNLDRIALLNVGPEVRGMRNWPLFLFLAGLVFIFYFLYIYQAQSTKYEVVRSELEEQVQEFRSLKVDFFNVKAEIERVKSSENNLKAEKNKLLSDLEFSSSSLRHCKMANNQLQANMDSLKNQSIDNSVTIMNLQQKIEVLNSSNENLQKALSDQEGIISQLKDTISKLEAELSRLNHGVSGKNEYLNADLNVTHQTHTTPEFSSIHQTSVEASQQQHQKIVTNMSINTRALKIGDGTNTSVSVDVNRGDTINQHALNAPPQKPGDRVKLDVAAEERSLKEKPLVKSGNYGGLEDDTDGDVPEDH